MPSRASQYLIIEYRSFDIKKRNSTTTMSDFGNWFKEEQSKLASSEVMMCIKDSLVRIDILMFHMSQYSMI